MAGEQRHQAAASAGDAGSRHVLRQIAGGDAAQTAQRVDHRTRAAQQRGRARIGAEFALTREVHHDGGSQDTEHDLTDDHGDHIADARAAGLFVVAAQKAVHQVADHARQEEHESVDHALDQRQRHHVAVLNVCDFVRQHRLHFFFRHRGQQAGGHRHQRIGFARACGEGVGLPLVHRHLGHRQIGAAGQLLHGIHQPALGIVAGCFNHARASAPFGHGLGEHQRNEGAAKAHYRGEAQQRAQVQAVARHVAVQPQQAGHNAQHHHHGDVGGD